MKRKYYGEIPIPFWSTTILGLSILLYKKPELEIDVCTTEPYAPDGDVPLIFIKLGWIEFIFESKWLYKKIYKWKYKYEPWGLD